MIRYNNMYAIHLVDMPNKGDYLRRASIAISFTIVEQLACLWIESLLHIDGVTLVLDGDMVYDVYSGRELVGYCVINAI